MMSRRTINALWVTAAALLAAGLPIYLAFRH